MSFGRPPTYSTFSVTPPAKGSFPLDHEGECKEAMAEYMRCLKQNSQNNGACRHLSQRYLECRMDRNLMEREPLPNLGFQPDAAPPPTKAVPGDDSSSKRTAKPPKDAPPKERLV